VFLSGHSCVAPGKQQRAKAKGHRRDCPGNRVLSGLMSMSGVCVSVERGEAGAIEENATQRDFGFYGVGWDQPSLGFTVPGVS
jgi:hypothetical protein